MNHTSAPVNQLTISSVTTPPSFTPLSSAPLMAPINSAILNCTAKCKLRAKRMRVENACAHLRHHHSHIFATIDLLFIRERVDSVLVQSEHALRECVTQLRRLAPQKERFQSNVDRHMSTALPVEYQRGYCPSGEVQRLHFRICRHHFNLLYRHLQHEHHNSTLTTPTTGCDSCCGL